MTTMASSTRLVKYVDPVLTHYAAVGLELYTLHTVTLNFWTENWRTSYSGPPNQFWLFYTFLFLSWAPAQDRQTDGQTDGQDP